MVWTLALACAPAVAAMPESVEWTLVDLGQQQSFSLPDTVDRLLGGGELTGSPEGSEVSLRADYETPEADATADGQRPTQVKVRVTDTSGQDRGLTVRLDVGLPPGQWAWMHDPDTAQALSGEPQSNTTALRGLPGLPYFTDEAEKPEYGSYSTYPLGVVERGGEWLALGRPLDQLALVRFSAEGGEKPRLIAEVDLALSEFTDPPRSAEFTLWFARGEAPEGRSMRAALRWVGDAERAQERYPGSWPFGGWMPFADLAGIPNVDEFGFAYQEGGRSPGFCDTLGANSFVYFHCAGEFANVDGYERGTEPLPPYEDIVTAFNAVAKGRTGLDGLWDLCGIRTADGTIGYRPERTYGDFFCQACVDPDLPYGRKMAHNLIGRVTAQAAPEGIDGVYYDGIAAGLDYAPSHLEAADHMLLWDGNLGRPVNYNLWSSAEWSHYIHEYLRNQGKLTMLNDSSLSSFPFVGPYIDVPGAEMSIHLRRDQCRLIRTLMQSKPFCTLVKADFSQISQAQIETYMRRCVAYAILFGFFDITPSGANPGSSYWEHPEWYDRDRSLFRRYMPLARELLQAGWDPLPRATIRSGEASVELFGPMGAPTFMSQDNNMLEEGLQYLTLSTDPAEDLTEASTVDVALPPMPESMPPFPFSDAVPVEPLAVELLTGRIEPTGEALRAELTGEDLQVWAYGTKQAQARGCLRRAADIVKRREQYIAACQTTGQELSPWAAYGDFGASVAVPGRDSDTSLEVRKDQAGLAGATQTITVNHDEPRNLVVSAWSKAEGVTGDQDRDYALYVDCYYTDGSAIYGQTVESATGTHDWEYGERTIEPEKPIRNINVYLLFRGAHTGTVWFDDVRVALASDPDTNLLARGDFEAAGEPRPLTGPSAQAERLTALCTEIGRYRERALDEIEWPDLGAMLDEMDRMVASTDWTSDTERAERDAEDLRWHVELAKACLKGAVQPAQRPSRLTELVALDTPRVSTGPKQYKATTGKVPQGTIVAVDGNFSGYTPTVLTDGKINPQGAHWTKVAWASAEHDGPHWIELRFPSPVAVREVHLWAGMDGGTLHVPQKLEAQAADDDEWIRVEGQPIEEGDDAGLTVIHLPGEPLRKLRILQAPHGGSKSRPDLMWISEIQVVAK